MQRREAPARLASPSRWETAQRTMTERDDTTRVTPDHTAAGPQPPNPAADRTAQALSPAIWVTGLIVLVLLLLAAFGLD